MDDKLLKSISDYYILKTKYENSIHKLKKTIKDKDLSIKEKKQQILGIKKKCIKCKKEGGTIFSRNDKTLTAICGAKEPCSLNISITRNSYYNIRDEDIYIFNKINKLKSLIIITKLDLIFKYSSEKNTIQKFDELKKELFDTTKYLLNIRKKYLNIIHNKNTSDTLSTLTLQLYEEIINMRSLGVVYKENEEFGIIKTMIEKYISILQPLVKHIREMKYNKCAIEYYNNTHNLIQKTYTLEDLYIPILNEHNLATKDETGIDSSLELSSPSDSSNSSEKMSSEKSKASNASNYEMDERAEGDSDSD